MRWSTSKENRVWSTRWLLGTMCAGAVGAAACGDNKSNPLPRSVQQHQLIESGDWTEAIGDQGSIERVAPGAKVLTSSGTSSTYIREDLANLGESYTLRFRQKVLQFGSEQGTVLYDGNNRIHLYFYADKIRARQLSGPHREFSYGVGTSWHEYEVAVEDGVGTLFVDGEHLGSWPMHEVSSSPRVDHWVKGVDDTSQISVSDTSIDYSGAFLDRVDWQDGLPPDWQKDGPGIFGTHHAGFLDDNNHQSVTEIFKLLPFLGLDARVHFRLTVEDDGGENGFVLHTSGYRAMLYIESGGVRVRQLDGTTITLHHFEPGEVFSAHDYEVVTRGDQGHLYVDGRYAGEWNLEASSVSPRIKHWVKGKNGENARSILYYTYTRTNPTHRQVLEFDFDAEDVGQQPYFWWETNTQDTWEGDVWGVETEGSNHVYRKTGNSTDGSLSLLHYFARDVTFSGTFKIESSQTQGGTLYLQGRRNSEEARVCVTYDIASGEWRLLEKSGIGSSTRTLDTTTSPVPFDEWVFFQLSLHGDNAYFFFDTAGAPPGFLSAADVRHQTFGRLGIQAKGAEVSWDSLRIEQSEPENSRVSSGVREYSMPDNGTSSRADVVKLTSGDLLYNSDSSSYLSTDDGNTWSSTNRDSSSNMLVLDDGRLLLFGFEQSDCPVVTAEQAAEGFGQSEKPFVEASYDGGLTTTGRIFITDQCVVGGTMPNKVSVDTFGRIFFGLGNCPNMKNHCGNLSTSTIFYSDDRGGTWQASTVDPQLDGTSGISFETPLDYDPAVFSGFSVAHTSLTLAEVKVVQTKTGEHKAFFRTNVGYIFESRSMDGGETWGTPRATIFRATRTSFNVERDPATGDHYIAWEYDDRDNGGGDHLPRSRVALARSRDGTESWEFLLDLDDYQLTDPFNPDRQPTRHMNTGLKVIDNRVWVSTHRTNDFEEQPYKSGSDYFHRSRAWRVDINQLVPSPRFPGTH